MKKIRQNLLQKYKVKRSFSGLGLFAQDSFTKGEFVIQYKGPIISDHQAEEKNGRYIFELGKNRNIDGSSRDNIARYLNHCCKPNCEAINEDEKNIMIYTKRAIQPGEELTYDYGKEYVQEFCNPCLCPVCRT